MSSIRYPHPASITAVVLAGGRARRMGGKDKGLLQVRGKALVAYALESVAAVADRVLISANRNRERYASFGVPVIADAKSTFEGPLAGLLSAMRAAETPYVLAVPCDSPRMTGILLQRLVTAFASQGAEIAAAHDGQRLHPVFLLAERRLADDLDQFLRSGGRKLESWLTRHRLALADFSDRPEALFNVNNPGELAELESRALGETS